MARRLILSAAMLFLAAYNNAHGCESHHHFYAQLGVVSSTNPSHLPGRGPLLHARIGTRWMLSRPDWFADLYYMHESSIPDGEPINARPDWRWHDTLGLAIERRWRSLK